MGWLLYRHSSEKEEDREEHERMRRNERGGRRGKERKEFSKHRAEFKNTKFKSHYTITPPFKFLAL